MMIDIYPKELLEKLNKEFHENFGYTRDSYNKIVKESLKKLALAFHKDLERQNDIN
jgi:hypothetical protein